MKRDSIYAGPEDKSAPFEFNEAVAEVFPDMIRRSVPGYERTIAQIERLAALVVTEGTVCYDLGCSLGAAAHAMARGIRCQSARIVAIDNSAAMIKRCPAATPGRTPIEFRLQDLRDTPIANASLVVLNYTLQFLPPDDRNSLLRRIRRGMRDGAGLLLSEKIRMPDRKLDELFISLHHEFKRSNAYSELEISRKRAALEAVLVPDTPDTHVERLRKAGFRHVGTWMQELNFASFIALA